MFVTFRFRGLNNFELYCILTIEAWLKLNINFYCWYLELCIFSLVFIVLNVRDEIELKYPSIVFLSISYIFDVYCLFYIFWMTKQIRSYDKKLFSLAFP